MFFTNAFSFTHRERLAEYAYQKTLSDLRGRRAELAPLLARHGLSLDAEVLADHARTLLSGLQRKPPRRSQATSHLHRALDDLDLALERVSPAGTDRARPRQKQKRRARTSAGTHA